MAMEQGGNVAELLARYQALLRAEQTGPPSPERRAQLQALAAQLRPHHATLLADMEQQVKSMKQASAKTPPSPTGNKPASSEAQAPATKAAPPDVQYIDPQLGDKLRKQLAAMLAAQSTGKSSPG